LSEFGLTELREEERRVKEEGIKIQNTIKELKKKLKKLSKEELEEINELTSDKTLNEIKADLNEIEARIETANTHGKDIDTIIQNFKRLEEDITTIEARIENQTKEVESLTRRIYTIRSDWEPKLERLVSHVSREFSLAFEAIGCSGKVVLKKDDDNAGGNNNNFTNWAIQIMVSFRAGVEMQPLTGQRQSGGERAVSTILYLMALQELANSPFRVVDEINQGMDPSNERMVHNRMVEVACQTNTSQYFLITPKLLPNLTYDPRMRVSCIFSGPFVANINNHDLSSNSMVRNITALANN
jgi:chromosome segregation ATPase